MSLYVAIALGVIIFAMVMYGATIDFGIGFHYRSQKKQREKRSMFGAYLDACYKRKIRQLNSEGREDGGEEWRS